MIRLFSDSKITVLARHRSTMIIRTDQSTQLYVLKSLAEFTQPEVAQALSQIRHAGLPACLGRTEFPCLGEPCFVFEYMPGKALTYGESSKMNFHELIGYFSKLCRLLGFLQNQGNQSIWHLDLKPANMLVLEKGNPGLIDFAAARLVSADHNDKGMPHDNGQDSGIGTAGSQACTPAYAAPELLTGHPAAASDQYAIGLVMLELLTGLPPESATGHPLADSLALLPPEIAGPIGRCLISDPDKRYPSFEHLAYMLEQAIISLTKDPAPGWPLDKVRYVRCKQTAWPAHGLSERISAVIPPEADPSPDEATKQTGQTIQDEASGQLLKSAQEKPSAKIPAPLQAESSAQVVSSLQAPPEETASAQAQPEGQTFRQESHVPVICVWDGCQFACEMATVLSKQFAQVLVIDADYLNPQADLLLGQRVNRDQQAYPGLETALLAARQQTLTPAALKKLLQPTSVGPISLLFPSENPDTFEKFGPGDLCQVIRSGSMIADIIVIAVNRLVYDAFTCTGLMVCDHVLMPLHGHIGAFREARRALDFLRLNKQLRIRRVHMIAFDYDVHLDLSQGTLNELCDGHLLGTISTCPSRREKMHGAVPYAANLNRQNAREYETVIRRLHLKDEAYGNKSENRKTRSDIKNKQAGIKNQPLPDRSKEKRKAHAHDNISRRIS